MPDSYQYHAGRGQSYEALGKLDQACRDYKKSYDLGLRSDWFIKILRKHNMLP